MRKEKILIIEDEMDLLDLVDFNLTRAGFVTAGALDGKEGLEKFQFFVPELVILDLMLPGMDGWAICREIKRRRKDTKVLILTAKGMPEDKVNGFETGADDYMTKPFGIKELMARVENLASVKRQADLQRTIIHDISNRMTAINAYSALLASSDSEKSDKYIERMASQADYAQELIREAESFLEPDGLYTARHDVDLQHVLVDIARTYKGIAAQKGISITCSFDETLALKSNAFALKQLVSNLISNAIKYSGANGKIQINTGKSGKTIWISIKDNGIGIPAAALPNIFEKGFRAGNAVKAAGGSGLGLYLVKLIAERLGAELEVRSTEGEGSEFLLYFGLQDDAVGSSHPVPEPINARPA